MKKSEIKIWIGLGGIFITILVAAFRIGGQIGSMNEKIMTALQDLPQMKADISELKTKVAVLDVKVNQLDVKVSEMSIKISEMSAKVDVLWEDHLSSPTHKKLKKASLPVVSPHSPSVSTSPQAAR